MRSRPFPPLLPTPKNIRRLPGRIALRDRLPIVLHPQSNDADFATARLLRSRILEDTGIELAVETHGRMTDLGPRVELYRSGARGQSYELDVQPERIELQAEGPAGLRYAVETLVQLTDRMGRVPACRIQDEPDLDVRGILIDVSRGKVPTLDTLFTIVDVCARLKMNALMLYTEHTFRFRRHPQIGADASPLTAEAMRQLDAYAADNHVELIPTLQTLGHMHHILKLPRYRHLGETDRCWTISPSEPETYLLLKDLLDEYLPNFRSRLFNANCDEPVDLGQGKSSERARELGPGGVYIEHVKRVQELALGHGKRTMIWGDVVHANPESIDRLDRDLVLLDWWYEATHDYERVRVFSEHGIDFLVCPGTSSWNALFPRLANSINNISGYATAGKRFGAWGLINTDWGDGGHYNLLGYSWFGFAWSAQEAWGGEVSPGDFDRAFSRLFFGDRRGKIAHVYRRLGALHGAGFPVFNGSPLQSLYFDDLGPAKFTARAKSSALTRTEAGLQRVRATLADLEGAFVGERLTHQELLLAADASLLAVRKATCGLEYLEWRHRPESLGAAQRRRLSRRLQSLASEQTELGRRLWRLWRERNQLSNFEITRRKLDVSIRSLRRAAHHLDKNRPPPPPRI